MVGVVKRDLDIRRHDGHPEALALQRIIRDKGGGWSRRECKHTDDVNTRISITVGRGSMQGTERAEETLTWRSLARSWLLSDENMSLSTNRIAAWCGVEDAGSACTQTRFWFGHHRRIVTACRECCIATPFTRTMATTTAWRPKERTGQRGNELTKEKVALSGPIPSNCGEVGACRGVCVSEGGKTVSPVSKHKFCTLAIRAIHTQTEQ